MKTFKKVKRQLFLTSSADTVLEDLVKHLHNKPGDYKLAFITTASEVEDGEHWWVTADKDKLIKLGFGVDEFSITGMNIAQLEEKMKDKNGIFVCGGNTFYLLDQVVKTGFDKIIKEKIADGCLYIGSSAGSMIVGKGINLVSKIDDRSKAPDLKSDGLGIVDFAILPHWGSLDFKAEYGKSFDAMYVEDIEVILLNNNQYLYIDGDISRIEDI
jgi:dipeptidase E